MYRLNVRVSEGTDQSYLDLISLDHTYHLLGAARPDDNIDAWIALTEGVEDPGQHVCGDGQRRAEAQGAQLDVSHVFQGISALL